MIARKPVSQLACVSLAALAWCAVLVVFRTVVTESSHYLFLVWNLGLATVPALISTLIRYCEANVIRGILGLLWLLFLPNAPYIVTDLVHLRALDSGPLWLDALLVASCAGTGLAMGYISVMQIQHEFTRAKRPRLGVLVCIGALFLSAFGIYLGRFQRWHSIDLLIDPLGLLPDLIGPFIDPLLHSRAWEITIGYGTSLCMGYAFFTTLREANHSLERTGPQPAAANKTP
jgi:uncharacterized membrane protein